MKVRVDSKSALEQYIGNGKQMSLMVYFQFLDSVEPRPTGVICSKEDFEKYQVGELYEIK